ncbi:putative calpain-like cysteine peptidase putative cysteine peptidase Clan CA family C2 [Leptomonas seymouri]|uniref:Putative calpain-like cysteine peptidase putative cysteine peptidase Clan CA family C2 n=1 Tax=Leptomonas seymouri TaxID=5684 RepID=A0A0N1PE91_LEPSE|nr:putative calpain-like cysteine peptidase putative cysteine peptidase Clan CA family C2 [Leptomonas seymouri]|eukprot:KPI90322.1 putative calpain-like cysteine peptidase putative cysteine peptidase Clan CA family C2 [Leptomonas seymouri]
MQVNASPSREQYELNDEAMAALRAAVANDNEKLKKLEERFLQSNEQAARRTALEGRIALLKSRNAALREAVQPLTASTNDLSGLAMGSFLSSTSLGNTTPAVDSSLALGVLDGPGQGPSISSKAAAATVSSLASVDELDENTISKDSPPVPGTWGSRKSVFRYAGPNVKGIVSSVVPDVALYRIITDRGEWAFYNDTRYYVAQVRYRLLGNSAVVPGPSVTVTQVGVDKELSMEVGPEETKVLLRGRVADFENLSAVTLLPKRAATAEEEQLLCREAQTDWMVIAATYPRAAAGGVSGGSRRSSDRSTMNTEELLRCCIEHHIRFVDPVFRPCHSSLYRHNIDEFFIPPLHWRPPFKYLPDDEKVRREVRLFRGPCLDLEGLHGGHYFPDNTFLSCVSGLVFHCPPQLRALFFHPNGAVEGRRERAVGAFRVNLCRGGWWESLIVDGFLPAASTCPEFSHCADDLRLLWLPLLQKACAKLWKSYAASLNATMESLIGLLTGGPCFTLRELWPSRDDLRANTIKATRFFSMLKRLLWRPDSSSPSFSHAGVMYLCWLQPYSTTTARLQNTRDQLEKLYSDIGLTPGTAAVVLGLETLEDGQCMVQLRQTAQEKKPAEEWLDVWRNARKPWVDSVNDLVFALDGAKGTVWMAFEDIPQYFQSGYLSPLTVDWAAVKARGRFTNRKPLLALQVDVRVPTQVIVTVTQAETESESDKREATIARSPSPSEKSETVKTDSVLAGVSCLAFSSGTGAALRFVGSNGYTADMFELSSTAPHFTYERDVSAGFLLEPRSGPYYFVPCLHANSLDVPYTLTVQAQLSVSAENRGAPTETSLSVLFVKVDPDAALFKNLVKPALRQASIVPYTSPLAYQTRALHQRRIVNGEGVSVSLAL